MRVLWYGLQGPVSSKDLETRERLNRPVINVMQRHPGNQMPEAQYIVQVQPSSTFYTDVSLVLSLLFTAGRYAIARYMLSSCPSVRPSVCLLVCLLQVC